MYRKLSAMIKTAINFTPGAMISLETFIDNLNKDLELEYSAAIQYVQHASVIQGRENALFSEELLKHADEEFAHAKKLSEKINFLGGIPSVNVEAIQLSGIADEMLNQDLSGEKIAIERYKQRIVEAESLREFGVRKMLEEILSDEEEHANDIETFLNLVKKID